MQFEYTTQLGVTADLRLVLPDNENLHTFPPVQFMLCLKTHSSRKINSHRWLLAGFGRRLNPHIMVCLDVGTKARPSSLHVGGFPCRRSTRWSMRGSSLHAWERTEESFKSSDGSTEFEYKVSYQLDRDI